MSKVISMEASDRRVKILHLISSSGKHKSEGSFPYHFHVLQPKNMADGRDGRRVKKPETKEEQEKGKSTGDRKVIINYLTI